MSTASVETGQKWSRALGWGWVPGVRTTDLILCSLSLETLYCNQDLLEFKDKIDRKKPV